MQTLVPLGALPSCHLTLKAYRPKVLVPARRAPILPGTLGYRIWQARASVGLEQAEVAQAIGVTVCTIRNWERGRSYPLRKAHLKLMRLLRDERLFG
jgi:DNA-binding transcriptional regulator YiaG